MTTRIKGWDKFQHFKDRRPPWIKLYRDILDDPEWFALDPEASKALVMLWLIASETEGYLPDINKISFRLRISVEKAKSLILDLSHWLEQDDISVISPGYQVDTPETETEKNIYSSSPGADGTIPSGKVEFHPEGEDPQFDAWWELYPLKVGKGGARKAFVKAIQKASPQSIMAATAVYAQQRRGQDQKYTCHPQTWLNQERWSDDSAMPQLKTRRIDL